MKKTVLFTACLLATSFAMAGGDSAKHSKRNKQTSERSQFDSDHRTGMSTGYGMKEKSTRISDMNDFRYSKTFGARELTGEESASAEPSARFNPGRRDRVQETTTTRTTTMESDSETSSTGAGSTIRSEDRSRYGVGAVDVDSDSETSSTGAGRDDSAESMETSRKDSERPAAGAMMGDREETRSADKQARQNERDLEITRQIRQEIMKNDKLSARAQNLTIVTENGRVSIRGTVNDSDEKSSVEQIARGVSGVTSVNNQVTVSR